jgi:hypothetical protein
MTATARRHARAGLAAIAAARVVIGVAATLRPDAARLAVGGSRFGTRPTVLTRSVGARDLAIGLMALSALRSERSDALVTAALVGTIADAGDALAFVLAAPAWPTRRWLPVAAVAAASAGASALLARVVDDG